LRLSCIQIAPSAILIHLVSSSFDGVTIQEFSLADHEKKFETARTRYFRSTELKQDDQETINRVERFGCSVVHIGKNGAGPGWTCLHHPIDADPSLKELANLPIGWCGKRTKPGEPWIRQRLEPEENSDEG
jgi:hypothetical protein